MKILNLSEVYEEAKAQLESAEWDISDIMGLTVATLIVTNIYTTNDICRGYGQDYRELDISIISSPHRMSVIMMGAATFVKSDKAICGYDNLSEDIYSILVNIQACIDRLNL